MTKPERFTESELAVQRGRWLGKQTVTVMERGQQAIDETRVLLMEISRQSAPSAPRIE